MSHNSISKKTLNHLKKFAANNNRAWFALHKEEHQAQRAEFIAFVALLAEKIATFDPHIKRAIDHNVTTYKIFRVYRDVRFSNNKTPYKTNMSAVIGGDRVAIGAPIYYISIQPGGKSFMGGGMYSPGSEALANVRSYIAEHPEALPQIENNRTFKKHFPKGLDKNLAVKTAPRGYTKDHPAIASLRLKSYTTGKTFTDVEVLSDTFLKNIMQAYKALTPLQKFLFEAGKR